MIWLWTSGPVCVNIRLPARLVSDISSRLLAVQIVNLYIAASAPGNCETFPNVSVALHIYLCMLVTNCSGERSFSVLSRVKNEIRTTMSDERLNALSLMAIESLSLIHI